MFSYKGIDIDYKYKRGTIVADSELDAIEAIKAQKDIVVVVSLKKVSSIRGVNEIRESLNTQIGGFENKLNEVTGKIVRRRRKSVLKSDDKKSKETEEVKEESLLERSPILKGINNMISNITPSSRRKVIVDDDMYSALEDMFEEREDKNKRGDGRPAVEFEFQESMDSAKLSEVKKSTAVESKGDKKVDWSLLDISNDPAVKDNKKIKTKSKEIIMFTRRLNIMLSSGVALLSALMLLQKTSGESLSIVLGRVIEDIQNGHSFSEAIAKFPNQFSATYVSLIAVGETSGGIEQSLKDIIKTMEQQEKVKKKIKVVSIYPAVVGVLLSVMMVLGSIFFLPMITDMYDDASEASMPQFTKVVLAIMDKVPYIMLGVTVFIVIFSIVKSRVPEVEYLYRSYIDKFKLKIPVLNDVTNASYMYSFSSTVGLMLKNGIRLSDALSLTERTVNNIYIKDHIRNMSELMIHGLTFSEAMGEQEYFDELLSHIVMTGEESGQMVFSLEQVSDYYEDELMQKVDSLMELVQPITIILVGLIVGVVLAAIYLPILDMSTGVGL